MPMDLIQTIRQSRLVSVPEIYIRTWDPASVMQRLMAAEVLNSADHNEPAPIVRWDIADGMSAVNEAGGAALSTRLPPLPNVPLNAPPPPDPALRQQQLGQRFAATRMVNTALTVFESFPEDSVAFFLILSPAEFFRDPVTVQKLYSLRDKLKANGRMLLLLGPHHELPQSLAHDIHLINDPLPTLDDLTQIVTVRYEDVKANNQDVAELNEDDITVAATNMQGLTSAEAETAIALSFKYVGEQISIDYPELREQRYVKIDETPGLSVERGGESFDLLKGLDGVKDELLLYAHNIKRQIGGVIYVDEIDKAFRGINGGDNTGTADAFLRGFLMFLDKLKAISFFFLGLPGTGKTAMSKALGNYIRRPTLIMDTDKMLSKYLGESQGNLHRAFATAEAVTGGCPIVIVSCNEDAHLPSPFLRRMRGGRIFFDQPGREDKDLMWESKMGIYELPLQTIPNDDDWTGAEIDVCCEKSYLLDRTLIESAQRIIPIARTRQKEIAAMREAAHGKYICARTGKPYVNHTVEDITAPVDANGRKIVVKREQGH